jgi:hypothetical protein
MEVETKRYKILIRERGAHEATKVFEFSSRSKTAAENTHSEIYNENCAHTDRFTSAMYRKTPTSRWRKQSAINW